MDADPDPASKLNADPDPDTGSNTPSYHSRYVQSYIIYGICSVADPDPGSGIGCLFDPLDPGSGMGESQHPDLG